MKSMHRFLVPALVLAALALGVVGVAFAREFTESVYIKLTTEEREFSGVVQAIDGNTWTIDGLKVVVDDKTEIKDTIALGQVVNVHVRVGADGSMTAREIELISMDAPENANDNEDDDIFDDDNANENEDDDVFDDDNANDNEDDDLFEDDNANDNEDDNLFEDNNANDNEDGVNEDEEGDAYDDDDANEDDDSSGDDYNDSDDGDHEDDHDVDHDDGDHEDDSNDDDSGEESSRVMRLALVATINL